MGVISGYQNEINKDNVALVRKFIMGYDYGVIQNGFNATITTGLQGNSAVLLQKGLMFAYGYVGGILDSAKIDFSLPSGTQYHFIYAEIDMSRIPNVFSIKTKNNGRATTATWRQDYLSSVRTGIFQLPLWRVKLTNNGIAELTDLRESRTKLFNAIHAVNAVKANNVGSNARATTQTAGDNSTKIATTAYVKADITRIFKY